jgi:hypothetical protein
LASQALGAGKRTISISFPAPIGYRPPLEDSEQVSAEQVAMIRYSHCPLVEGLTPSNQRFVLIAAVEETELNAEMKATKGGATAGFL